MRDLVESDKLCCNLFSSDTTARLLSGEYGIFTARTRCCGCQRFYTSSWASLRSAKAGKFTLPASISFLHCPGNPLPLHSPPMLRVTGLVHAGARRAFPKTVPAPLPGRMPFHGVSAVLPPANVRASLRDTRPSPPCSVMHHGSRIRGVQLSCVSHSPSDFWCFSYESRCRPMIRTPTLTCASNSSGGMDLGR